jgi:hypothetical protein
LKAAFGFLQQAGRDYASRRLVAHFLLNCQLGLKLAQVARLVEPRYAGPVAHFLATHAEASRNDVLDFIETTWNIRVSRIALHNFLKKYGLDRKSLDEAMPRELPHPATDERALVKVLQEPPTSGLPVPQVLCVA